MSALSRQRANRYATIGTTILGAPGRKWLRMARRMAQEAIRRLLRPIGAIPDPVIFGEIQTRFSELLDLVFGAPGADFERFLRFQKWPGNVIIG